MTKNVHLFAAMALAIVTFAFAPSPALAQSYSGNWPIEWNVSYPRAFAGHHTFCLTLTDNGSVGFPHSGLAVLNGDGENHVSGIFQVIDNQLATIFLIPTDNGELDTLIFAAPATKGTAGKGFGEESFANLSGTLTFGTKGGCGHSE